LDDAQVKTQRAYSMELRAAAAEATRGRILEAAFEAFLENWYDDVTIASVARRAGVSGQTVLNHFHSKEGLFTAVHERFGQEVVGRRYRPEPGDVHGAVEALVEDYEVTGDAVVRFLALEEKVASVRPALEIGRKGHREWVETMFQAPPELTPELVVATDVYTWKLLRRDQGLTRDQTVASILKIVEALLERRTA
jgi:AcrR family transcriptional regulator